MNEPQGMGGAAPITLPLTSLVGRERDIAQVTALLQLGANRLLTLTGPGGVGKTRLALQVAAGLDDSFTNGAYFISLAPVTNPDLVLSTIAQTLGVPESPGQSLLSSLCAALRDRHLLLILDNFEQVVSVGPRVLDLLLCAPRLQVLVTSRIVLHVYGEQEYQVLPLDVPSIEKTKDEGLRTEDGRQQPTQHLALSTYGAVRLFVERARVVRTNFDVSNQNASAVAEICRRLDGLPLAIELAAARIKLMSPHALLARLDPGHALPLLTQGPTTLPYRHQTLRDAIAWSYDLLDDEEQRLFRCLSIFAGGCTLEAAEAVCDETTDESSQIAHRWRVDGEPSTQNSRLKTQSSLEGLAALVDKSLLRRTDQEDGEPRFLMLETIREFALDQLAASDEEENVGHRHTDYFLSLAERAQPELMGANQATWFDTLALEYDNLRSVFSRAQRAGDAEVGLRLGWALYHFWYIRGYLSEGRKWLSEAVAQGSAAPPAVRARALSVLGNLSCLQGEYDLGNIYHRQVLAIWQSLDNKLGIASVLGGLADTARLQGDYDRSRALREESIALFRELGDEWAVFVANGLQNLSVIIWGEGEDGEARRLCEEALRMQRKLGDTRGIAITLHNLGLIARSEGKHAESRAYEEESLALSQELGDKFGIASSCHALGELAADQGDYVTAHALHSDSLRIRNELGNKRAIAECLRGLASVEREGSDPRRLTRLFAKAESLHNVIGTPLSPRERGYQERRLDFARSELSPEAFVAEWEKGKSLPLDDAVTLALDPPKVVSQTVSQTPELAPVPETPPKSLLTSREVEVLRLIAAGLSNPDIAEYLSLSINTVQTHVRSILSKVNVKSRVAAVRYAFEHNLG